MKVEKRFLEVEGMKIETRDDGKPGKVGGYAAVFEKLSEPMGFGNMREKIQAGAFASSIQNGDIRAFWSHNTDLVLGRTKNGSLKLEEDAHGLRFDLQMPDTTLGRDAFYTIQRGDVSAMSFGFTVSADKWERGKDGQPHIRTLLDVNLLEISPTAFPAYPQTSVGVRSAEEMEELLKEALLALDKSENKNNHPALRAKIAFLERDLKWAEVAYK